MTNTKDMVNEEMKQFHCSILMEEVKEKVRMLKAYGLSEQEIVSGLHGCQSLTRLVISSNYRIYLGDERKEIKMEPLVKAVYLLFMRHPKGIVFKNLPAYREELTRIYLQLRPGGLTYRVRRSIEDVVNPFSNSINEKCSRIRAAFTREVDDSIVEQYVITGERGEAKKIVLPREFVVWE